MAASGRRRAVRSGTSSGVVSAAGNGLVIVLFVTIGLQQVLGLQPAHVIRGAGLFLLIMVLAIRNLSAHHPFGSFGPANQITTLRAALVSLVGAFVGAPTTSRVAATTVAIALLVTLLDGVDGWFARRTGMASAFGARFDMEIDALLILALSLLAWTHAKAPVWVLLSGLLRYAFVIAGWISRRMRQPLPPSRRRQGVCVVQVVSLITVMLPQAQPPVTLWLAAVALAVLIYSFAVDVHALWRQTAVRPLRAHP